MQLILKQDIYGNETLVTENVTEKDILEGLANLAKGGSIELIDANGSLIKSGFNMESNGYSLNLDRVLDDGSVTNHYSYYDLDDLSEIQNAFKYFISSDEKLNDVFVWIDSNISLDIELRRLQVTHLEGMMGVYPEGRAEFLELIDASNSMGFEELSAASEKLVDKIQASTHFDASSEYNSIVTSNEISQPIEQRLFTNALAFPEHILSGGSSMGVDRDNMQLVFTKLVGDVFENEFVPYSKIQSAEVHVDSESYIKTDRAGQIGGALIGGAVTGGIGALVMALGAKKKNIEKIRKVEFKIIVQGSANPVKIFEFSDGIFSSSKKMVDEAGKWCDLIHGLMAQGSVDEKINNNSSNQSSLAEEIQKLFELKNLGILTEAEFLSAKNKLIS